MTRSLVWIAAGGLGGGLVLLMLAYSLGGRDFAREASWHRWWSDTCPESDANADNGTPSERRWVWTGGDTIDIAVPGAVHFRAGDGNEVIARGSPNAVASVEVHGSRIVIRCRHESRRGLEITLPGQKLHRFNIAGAARVSMEGLSQHELDLRISGSGEVDAKGAVDHMIVSLSGSGSARLGDVAMKKLTAHISGSGSIEAAPTDLADVKISGSGDVRLRGRPTKLRSHISGSGRITQASTDSN